MNSVALHYGSVQVMINRTVRQSVRPSANGAAHPRQPVANAAASDTTEAGRDCRQFRHSSHLGGVWSDYR